MLRLIRLLSFDSFHSLRSRKRSASKHAQDPRPKGAEAKPIFAMFVRVIIKILLRLPLLSVLLFSQCTKAFYDVLQMSPEGLSPVPMALFVTAENLISTITIQNP
ncbi:MAG: hypothetical protein KDK45_21670, partial [Leptospiraceae bacterium]|nr:hypothetical protein [Leptospiraceae bacterium]